MSGQPDVWGAGAAFEVDLDSLRNTAHEFDLDLLHDTEKEVSDDSSM